MIFVRPRSAAGIMTAALGEAIEAARKRANAATDQAGVVRQEEVSDAWRHASNALDAYIIADPSSSHANVIEAFQRVAP